MIFMMRGGEFMMAMMFAINIANDNWTFAKVPAKLKPAVKKQLELMELGHLAVEDGE